ncbi:unnamed protein product [Closterium sp. NIES-64]|nr:unnamed protein product [Closterium sp. NIES-64]
MATILSASTWRLPLPSWCAFFCRFYTTSSFSPHPIRFFTLLLLLSSFFPPFRASPPFLHLLLLHICHLATCYYLPLGDRDPTSSPQSAPSPSSSSSLSLYFPHPLTSSSASLLSLSVAAGSCLFSLLPLFLCASALILLLPYLLSYPCLPYSPLPSLPLPPLAPLLLVARPPLFSTPLL